jgi:hypothetical protein
MAKPTTTATTVTGTGGGAGVGISPPRHDQLVRPTPPSSRPGVAAQAGQPRSTPSSPATGSPTRKGSAASSPNGNGSGFRPNNPFAQRQYQRQQAQYQHQHQQSPRLVDTSHPALEGSRARLPTAPPSRGGINDPHSPSPLSSPLPLSDSPSLIPTLSPAANVHVSSPTTQPLAVPLRRRVPPPEHARAHEISSPPTSGPIPPTRRPVPALTSPEMSGIPRLTSPGQSQTPRMGQGLGLGVGMGMGMPMGMGLGTPMGMPVPRPAIRQPSTPALLGGDRKPITDSSTSANRPRAKSTATPTPSPAQNQLRQIQQKISPSPIPVSVEREAAVPPHIRVRLRLIHRLGVVLGVEASAVAAKIDIPALLARVDAAYDRGHGGFIDLPGQDAGFDVAAVVASPPPQANVHGHGHGKKEGGGGMMGMFRKLGGGISSSNSHATANQSGSGGGGKGTGEEPPLVTNGGSSPSDGMSPCRTLRCSKGILIDRTCVWRTII